MAEPQLPSPNRPNYLKRAAFISSIAVGVANALTLSNIVPVSPEVKVITAVTAIIPAVLFWLTSVNSRRSKLYDEAATDMLRNPASNVTMVKHNKVTGQTTVEYGNWTEEDRQRMKDLDEKLK